MFPRIARFDWRTQPDSLPAMLSTQVEPRTGRPSLSPRVAYAHVAAVIGLSLSAVRHLPGALGLLAGRADADLRDLCLRRARRAAARRPGLGRDRPPPG